MCLFRSKRQIPPGSHSSLPFLATLWESLNELNICVCVNTQMCVFVCVCHRGECTPMKDVVVFEGKYVTVHECVCVCVCVCSDMLRSAVLHSQLSVIRDSVSPG